MGRGNRTFHTESHQNVKKIIFFMMFCGLFKALDCATKKIVEMEIKSEESL